MSVQKTSISVVISFLLITLISACTLREDKISLEDVPPENAMDIAKINKKTNRITVYSQTANKPIPIKDCEQENVCFVIPLNSSMRVLEHVKQTGINQCGKHYRVYLAKVVLLDPNTLLDKLDGRVSADLKKAVEAYPKLMDVNYEYRPIKAIANSDFFLQADIGLYADQLNGLDKDFKAFLEGVDQATVEQLIINTLNHKDLGYNQQLINQSFPAEYTPHLSKQQLFSGTDGGRIMILGQQPQLNEFTAIENDAELDSAFSCATQ